MQPEDSILLDEKVTINKIGVFFSRFQTLRFYLKKIQRMEQEVEATVTAVGVGAVFMSLTQKCVAYGFGFIDVFLHTMMIFGWSAFTEMYKKEGYFR